VKNLELKDYIPLPKPIENEKLRSKYDLVANIVHDGKPGEGCHRVFVQRKSEEAWYVLFNSFIAHIFPSLKPGKSFEKLFTSGTRCRISMSPRPFHRW
jgi:U4/U6.U5 tri-snRNP-associated protein 2